MNRYAFSLALAVVFGGAVSTAALAQGTPPAGGVAGAMDMNAVPVASITWTDANIPGFPAGMKMAVINGNPDVPGGSLYAATQFPRRIPFPAALAPHG